VAALLGAEGEGRRVVAAAEGAGRTALGDGRRRAEVRWAEARGLQWPLSETMPYVVGDPPR